jgi:hypothetical protein
MSQDNPIKTALEIALEKMRAVDIDSDELKQDELVTLGKHLAVKLLKNKNTDIPEYTKHQDKAERAFILQGIQFILLLNISLPSGEPARLETQKALEALCKIKGDTPGALELCAQIDQLLGEYIHAKEAGLEELKQAYNDHLAQAQQMVEQRTGQHAELTHDNLPEYQKQKQQLMHNIEVEYLNALNTLKESLRTIP